MTVINCVSQWPNVVDPVHVKEPKFKNSRYWQWQIEKTECCCRENKYDSNYDLSDFGKESDSSDPDIYLVQRQLLVSVIIFKYF